MSAENSDGSHPNFKGTFSVAADQAAHDLQCKGRVFTDDVLKAPGIDRDKFAVLPCLDGHRPRARGDEGEFAHDGAGAEALHALL